MVIMIGSEPLTWQRLAADPVVFYSACAGLLLALVSLVTGLLRGDVLVLFRPRLALRVLGAVLLGFLLAVAAEWLGGVAAGQWPAGLLRALARVPLYVVALAFGPSVGLFAGALFAAATAGGEFPGPAEALFAFELVVLGWLAIYPSPRLARWAGPFDMVMARTLTWGTGGVAWLTLRDGEVSLAGLVESSSRWPWGLLVAAVALYLIAPRWYGAAFPHSRIAPDTKSALGRRDPRATLAPPAPDDVFLTSERQRPPRKRGELPVPHFRHEDPNG
jgi:hypothetical protein